MKKGWDKKTVKQRHPGKKKLSSRSPLAQLVLGGTSLSSHRQQGNFVLWCGDWKECMWVFLSLTLPLCMGLSARQILWCDVLCEFRDRGRWKWFVDKSTRALQMKDVRFSMSLGGKELLKLRKWEWWWLITRQLSELSKNTCKTHGGPLLIWLGKGWNDRSFGFSWCHKVWVPPQVTCYKTETGKQIIFCLFY